MAEGEGEDEAQCVFKRPIEIRQSGASPFFEGEAELQNEPNIAPVCQQTFTGRRTAAWNEPRVRDGAVLCCSFVVGANIWRSVKYKITIEGLTPAGGLFSSYKKSY